MLNSTIVSPSALRLYPVFPWNVRVAYADTLLPTGGGTNSKSPIFVPAGTLFEANYAVLHRRQSIWGSDAGVFNPDRWATSKPGPWEYIPFGGGPRSCIGKNKAIMEASYITVRMLREFEGIEARDDREWTGRVQISAKNIHGCKVALFPVEYVF